MGAVNWRGLLGPPSLLISAALVIAAVLPAAIAAGPLPPPPAPGPPCPTLGLLAGGELAAARRASSNARVAAEALVTERGEETGRRLAVEPASGAAVEIGLPPESFVAGPFGGLLLYGWHAPAIGSQVRGIVLASGCDQRLATPTEIVRSAVLDGGGRALYVHSVTADGRRDAGVVRHDLPDGGQTQVVEPLTDSDEYGPTFATSLVWSLDGSELAVQSCGFSQCRTRVLDAASGEVQVVPADGHGALLGLDRRRLYAYAACHWSPCDVLAIDRASGVAMVLVEEAYEAVLTLRDGTSRLIVETAAGSREVVP